MIDIVMRCLSPNPAERYATAAALADGIDPEQVIIRFGDLETYPSRPDAEGLRLLSGLMAEDHVDIEVDLGIAAGEATVYGCDLSAGYVRINADYTT